MMRACSWLSLLHVHEPHEPEISVSLRLGHAYRNFAFTHLNVKRRWSTSPVITVILRGRCRTRSGNVNNNTPDLCEPIREEVCEPTSQARLFGKMRAVRLDCDSWRRSGRQGRTSFL
jgi:hypothetical protein